MTLAKTTAGTRLKLLGCVLVVATACYETASRAATDPKGAQAEATKPGMPKSEARKPDTAKPEAGKSEAKAEASKSTAGKADAAKPEAPKTEASKSEAPKTEASKTEAAKPDGATAESAPKTDPAMDDPMSPETHANVRKYCVNIAAAATDARFAWQSKKLQELEARVKARVTELDAKEAELKSWLDRRDAVAKEARESLVNIYAKMKPENAAAQISALDDEMATAVLAALAPGKASAIFNEITDPSRAAKLASMLATPSALQADKKL